MTKKEIIRNSLEHGGILPSKSGTLTLDPRCVATNRIAEWVDPTNEDRCTCGHCKVWVSIETNNGNEKFIASQRELYKMIYIPPRERRNPIPSDPVTIEPDGEFDTVKTDDGLALRHFGKVIVVKVGKRKVDLYPGWNENKRVARYRNRFLGYDIKKVKRNIALGICTIKE